MKSRVDRMDQGLEGLESQIDKQIEEIGSMIQDRQQKTTTEMSRADDLLVNIKDSHQLLQDQLVTRELKLVREVQLLLRRDDLEWKHIRTQLLHKLHTLQTMDWVEDFISEIEDLISTLEATGEEREKDDQGIMNMVNDVCAKMYLKFK